MGNVLAIYGAFVATIVALIKFQQHRATRKIFQIRCSDEFQIADGYVTLTITNLSNREVDIDFAGVGFGYRAWLRPWKIEFEELVGLHIFILEDDLREVQWFMPLKSGQLVFAELNGKISSLRQVPNWSRKGCGSKLYLEITHSLEKNVF